MLAFSTFFEYINESNSGKSTAFRGKLNEMAFVHAFNRYHELKTQFKGNHEKAMQALMTEKHLDHKTINKDHPFADKIKKIAKNAGHYETDRTLWDSHHAALSTINHIHKSLGEINGAPVWAGPDQTGGTVEKATGYNSPADMVVPTKNGWAHISLKYSAKEKPSPTKLTQKSASQLVEHIQKAHLKNFGKRDDDLDFHLKNLNKSYEAGSLNDEHIAKKLKAAGFTQDKKTGEFSKGPLSKLGRYASNLHSGKEADRHDDFREALRNHFLKNGISEKDHAKHMKNLADVYDNVIKSDKVTAGAKFMDAFHKATKRIYTEGKTDQHELIKNLLNLNPPGNGKIMVVKTQRSSKDHVETPSEALPKTAVGDHSNVLDSHIESDKENQAYDSVKADRTSTSTISAKKGHNIGRFSIDTGKSSPTIIGQAGNGIDTFKSIDDEHPSRTSVSKAPPPLTNKKTTTPRTKNVRTDSGEFGQHRGDGPYLNLQADHGGKSFYTPQEKMLMKGHA